MMKSNDLMEKFRIEIKARSSVTIGRSLKYTEILQKLVFWISRIIPRPSPDKLELIFSTVDFWKFENSLNFGRVRPKNLFCTEITNSIHSAFVKETKNIKNFFFWKFSFRLSNCRVLYASCHESMQQDQTKIFLHNLIFIFALKRKF